MIITDNELRAKVVKYGQYMYELGLKDANTPQNSYEVAEIVAEEKELVEV